MPLQVDALTRQHLRPEEEELFQKRAELATIQAILADYELQLADFRLQLTTFESQYLRQVGTLYAELDEWNARIYELKARSNPSWEATQQAEEARKHARQTHEAAHGKRSKNGNFVPSPELKNLFRELAKRIHPDLARNAADRERRNRFMAEANRAYQTGDIDLLHRILQEFHNGADAVEGDGIGSELIRVIRQISQVKSRVEAIQQELEALQISETALLKQQVEEAKKEGRDLLAELASAVRDNIRMAQKEYQVLAEEMN